MRKQSGKPKAHLKEPTHSKQTVNTGGENFRMLFENKTEAVWISMSAAVGELTNTELPRDE